MSFFLVTSSARSPCFPRYLAVANYLSWNIADGAIEFAHRTRDAQLLYAEFLQGYDTNSVISPELVILD